MVDPNPNPAGAPTPDPAPAPSGAADWKTGIPEDLRGDPALADIHDVPALAKSYIHAQHLVGGDRVAIPKEDAPREVWDQFFTKLGRPEKPEGYEVEIDDALITQDDDGVNLSTEFKGWAHEAGLSRTQAAFLAKKFQDFAKGQVDALNSNLVASYEGAEKTLKKEFGAAYDDHIALAVKATQAFGGDKLMKTLEETGFGNNPEYIRAMVKVGKAMSEDTLGPAMQRQGFGARTPNEAQRRIHEIYNDPDYMNPLAAKHKDLVKEIETLYPQAYPEGAGSSGPTALP